MSNETQNNEQSEAAVPAPSFSEFPTPSYEEWKAECDRILKGAPFEKRLVSRTYEGIDLQPMYQKGAVENLPHMDSLPGFAPYVRATGVLGHQTRPWDVSQELRVGTPEAFNSALISDLDRGQTAINLVLDRAGKAASDPDQCSADDVGADGISIASVADLATALDKVDLEKTPLFVQTGCAGLPLAALLSAYLRRHVKSLDQVSGCVGTDPLGALAGEGELPKTTGSIYDQMVSFTGWAKSNAPKLQTVLVQSHPYHDGGANATQELGYALATAVEYLRELSARGLAVDEIAPRIRFSFSLGSNFFMEISKLRAARMVWAKIVKEFGGNAESQKMFIHARTSEFNKTVYDPYVNMLRTTTEAFSGVLGGTDSLHVGPFDEILREPDEFSRRISRNTHIILREECHVPRTVDAAGGSWYVETLTDAVARGAWEVMQGVEKEGGMSASLKAGTPQAAIAKVADARAKNCAVRKDVIVGTNSYANMTEERIDMRPVDRAALQASRTGQVARQRESVDTDWRDGALKKLAGADSGNVMEAAIHAADGGATLGEIAAALGGGDAVIIEPVRVHRVADGFESLRQATEQFAERTGARPKAFLANMGPIPQHKARADFSRSFLEVGAFDVIGNNGFPDPAAAAKAAIDSGAPVVVICSTDPTYPDIVTPLVKAIKEVKPDPSVLLAGYPVDHVEAFKAAGVDDFIHLRANCFELLSSLQKKVGVQQ